MYTIDADAKQTLNANVVQGKVQTPSTKPTHSLAQIAVTYVVSWLVWLFVWLAGWLTGWLARWLLVALLIGLLVG